MKVSFAPENREVNVSTKSEVNKDITCVQKEAGNQVFDGQSKAVSDDNQKDSLKTDSEMVYFRSNGSEPKVLVERSGDHPQSEKSGSDENKEQAESPSSVILNEVGDEQAFLCLQPEWFTILDEISRGKVREYCELAGPPPSDSEYIDKLQSMFNIDHGQAVEVNELYHSGRLQGPSRKMYKSILKTSSCSLPSTGNGEDENAGVTITRRLSWRDEKGGNLVQKHEMDSWHYMDSDRRSPPPPCCQIL